jgi:hypothetical protein
VHARDNRRHVELSSSAPCASDAGSPFRREVFRAERRRPEDRGELIARIPTSRPEASGGPPPSLSSATKGAARTYTEFEGRCTANLSMS